MTIEEKAKEYIETCIDDDPVNPFAAIARIEGRDAFKRGAKWMIEKAADWFTNYLAEIGYPDDWIRDSKVQQSGMERFRKAMEE